MPKPSGALELTWTNKHLTLLSNEDGSYEWVNSSDHRVSEVRLLNDAGTIGETGPDAGRVKDNLLIRGDALHALTTLAKLPEFAEEYRGKVKLVYIDPPFNTGQAFAQYDDNLEHSVWLTMMRDRLIQIRELLAPNGSVWVHLDDEESHRARVLLDEVFGDDTFVGTVIWQKRTSRENRAALSPSHDFIHIYAPAGPQEWRHIRNVLPGADATSNPDNDPRGPWTSVPFSAQGFRKNQMYEIKSPNGQVHRPPKGRCWGATESEFRKLIDQNLIYFPRAGAGRPRVKQFEQNGLVPFTIWPSDEVGQNDEAKKAILEMFPEVEAFETPKPERLIERILHVGSDPGDIVLDCFVGSGTTAAVAHKMGRRWIAVEWSEDTLATFTIPRLTKVVNREDPGGITSKEVRSPHPDLPDGLHEGDGRKATTVLKKYFEGGLLGDMEEKDLKALQKLLRASDKTTVTTEYLWEGGGGFRILDVAASMFQEDEGIIYLADWAEEETLAEPVAAQLGYEYKPEPPFAGRRGRSRLAVIDGVVSTGVVDIITCSLGEQESVVICGTAVAPDARDHLESISRASRIRKIPASILTEYRLIYRRRRVVELRLQDETVDPDPVQETEPANA